MFSCLVAKDDVPSGCAILMTGNASAYQLYWVFCTPVVSGELTQSLLHIPCAETTYDKLSSLPKLSNNIPVEDFLRDEIVNEQFTRYES